MDKYKRYGIFILIAFALFNYFAWLNWSEKVDDRLKNLENKVSAKLAYAPKALNNTDSLDEQFQAAQITVDRYLCTVDNVSYFTQNQDQQNCRNDKLADGWRNLFFSSEQIFDYYKSGLLRTGNEVKVWSRMLTNSPKTTAIQQYNGTQNKIEFNELKSLLVFDCSTREYKNPNIVYLLDGKELLKTTGNRTTAMPNGFTTYSLDDKVEQIQPETFADSLFKEVCFKERVP